MQAAQREASRVLNTEEGTPMRSIGTLPLTSILTTSDTKDQVSHLEFATITTLKNGMNIQHKVLSTNSCWSPFLPKIAARVHNIPTSMEIRVTTSSFSCFCSSLFDLTLSPVSLPFCYQLMKITMMLLKASHYIILAFYQVSSIPI